MNIPAEKTQEKKSQAASPEGSQMESSGGATFQFMDNRPEVIAQRKLREVVNNSQAASPEGSQMESSGGATFQFMDNRPEAIAQRKLREVVDNSPRRVSQLKAFQDIANNSAQSKRAAQFQAMADNHSAQQQLPIQRQKNNTGLPDNLKSGMENVSGMSLDDVKVHQNSDKPAQLNAHAYAQGTDIHLGPGQEKHLPHELGHVVQQKEGRVKATTQLKGKTPINDDAELEKEADSMGAKALQAKFVQTRVDQRKATAFSSNQPAQLKANDEGVDEEFVEDLGNALAPGIVATGKTKVLNYLASGLGKGGANIFRSKEVRAFRAQLKMSARAQAWHDITEIIDTKEVFDGDAMKAHIEVVAKDHAYAAAKKPVDDTVQAIAEDWISRTWDYDAILLEAKQAAKQAAYAAYLSNKTNTQKAEKAANKAGEEAIRAKVDAIVKEHLAQAKVAKNDVLKPSKGDEVPAAEDKEEISSMVAEKAGSLGMESIAAAIKAETTEEGLGIVGNLIDQAIPMPGEQVSIDVTLQIPTPDGVGFVSIKLAGKAGRGITGFSTSGVTTLGDPKRLEIMAQFSLGIGAETFGLKGDLSVGFFTRAGANQGTVATMQALSFGAFQAAKGINPKLGEFWAGKGKGSEKSAVERSEIFSAAIEEQVFKKDDSAFVDLGVSGGVSGGINLKDVFNAEIGVGGEIFKRFDNASLKASMGDDFGAKVQSEEQARARSKKASGRTVTSMGVSAIVGVAINGQNVEFAGSLSMEDAENIKPEDKNEAEDNWGVEISASIGAGSDPLTKFEKMAAGIVTGALGVVAGLVKAWETKKRGAGIDILADITQIVNAGLENQITSSLGELASADGSKFDEGILTHITNPDAVPDPTSALGTSSSLQVAITFGKSSGKGVFRFEIRDSKSLDLSVGLGSASLSISASKGSRLLAVGYEEGGFATEAIGLRGPKSK